MVFKYIKHLKLVICFLPKHNQVCGFWENSLTFHEIKNFLMYLIILSQPLMQSIIFYKAYLYYSKLNSAYAR